ncbi:MAG: hypothetical protein FWG83_06540 [Oscillospiraceae bacterium]|nr:hypothetical protein [Oscillospiraceae bacterium]
MKKALLILSGTILFVFFLLPLLVLIAVISIDPSTENLFAALIIVLASNHVFFSYIFPAFLIVGGVLLVVFISRKLKSDIAEPEQELEELEESEEE